MVGSHSWGRKARKLQSSSEQLVNAGGLKANCNIIAHLSKVDTKRVISEDVAVNLLPSQKRKAANPHNAAQLLFKRFSANRSICKQPHSALFWRDFFGNNSTITCAGPLKQHYCAINQTTTTVVACGFWKHD
jgi:hypothetical protein